MSGSATGTTGAAAPTGTTGPAKPSLFATAEADALAAAKAVETKTVAFFTKTSALTAIGAGFAGLAVGQLLFKFFGF